MIEFTLNRSTTASPEAVFDTLTDHRAYKDFTPMRTSTLDKEGTPAPNGLGAVRRLGLVGPAIVEEVIAYERPTRFAYKVLSGLPVKEQVGTVTLTPSGSGTDISYHIRAEPKLPGGNVLMPPVLKKAIGDLLKGVVKAAERRT